MTCDVITMPGGGRAIVCSSRRRQRCTCGRPATLLCDWKVRTKRSGTCDRPICATCATCAASPAPGKDLCPAHQEALRAWNTTLLPGIAEMNEQMFGQGDVPAGRDR